MLPVWISFYLAVVAHTPLSYLVSFVRLRHTHALHYHHTRTRTHGFATDFFASFGLPTTPRLPHTLCGSAAIFVPLTVALRFCDCYYLTLCRLCPHAPHRCCSVWLFVTVTSHRIHRRIYRVAVAARFCLVTTTVTCCATDSVLPLTRLRTRLHTHLRCRFTFSWVIPACLPSFSVSDLLHQPTSYDDFTCYRWIYPVLIDITGAVTLLRSFTLCWRWVRCCIVILLLICCCYYYRYISTVLLRYGDFVVVVVVVRFPILLRYGVVPDCCC